jgi:hypothetical protein
MLTRRIWKAQNHRVACCKKINLDPKHCTVNYTCLVQAKPQISLIVVLYQDAKAGFTCILDDFEEIQKRSCADT